MSLNHSAVQRLADLSRLNLSIEQNEEIRLYLNGFLGLVEKMQAVDTTGIEPLAHPGAMVNAVTLRLCPDDVQEPNLREAFLSQAPLTDQGLFLVPQVIE